MTVSDMLQRARSRFRRLTPEAALREQGDGALLVDIRSTGQRRDQGVIPGAVVMERNVLEWRLDPASPWRIPQISHHGQRVIVVCAEGYGSSLAAASLLDLGLSNATDVIGGCEGWIEAGLPVETEDADEPD